MWYEQREWLIIKEMAGGLYVPAINIRCYNEVNTCKYSYGFPTMNEVGL